MRKRIPTILHHTHTDSVNAGKTPSRGSLASPYDARRARDSCCACASTSPAHARGKGLLRAVAARRRLCTEVADLCCCCSFWVAARRPGRGMNLDYPCARGPCRRRCCWAAASCSWGCRYRRWLWEVREHRAVLLRAEGVVGRDLVVVGQADVEDLLAAEEGRGHLWQVACGRLCYPGPGAIVVVCCCLVAVVLFCHHNGLDALACHAPFLRTLGRCGSRYRCSAALEGSTRRDPYRRFLRLEQVAGSFSSLDLFGESRVRDCLGTLASPRVGTVQGGP
jgi:hypothetical protein